MKLWCWKCNCAGFVFHRGLGPRALLFWWRNESRNFMVRRCKCYCKCDKNM